MSGLLVYLIGVPVVLLFTAVNTMAGLGTAFILVPILFWLGVPLVKRIMAAVLFLAAAKIIQGLLM